MSDASKVLWSEGLFLRAQHFQQQDRYAEALVRGAMGAVPLQTAGFRALLLDRTALDAGRVAIAEAEGILPDGTPFRVPETMPTPEPVTVGRDTPAGLVHLALPFLNEGAAAFSQAHEPPAGLRYHGDVQRVRDAVKGGAEAEDIEIARPVARLILPGEETGGYATLPIARIDGLTADGAVHLAEGFLPPATITRAAERYGAMLAEIATGLERIAEAHSAVVIGGAGRSVENLLILELANSALPVIRHLQEQALFHPAELYRELAGLAGRMATYGASDRRLTEMPAYDHFDPQPAFDALIDTLRALTLSLRHVEPKSRAMAVAVHAQNVWKIRIDSPDLLSGRIVLRVRSEMSDAELRKIFVDQATVGAADSFEDLWKVRLSGIGLKPLHSQPREIPFDGEALCLELDRKSEHWAALAEAPGFFLGVTGTLADEPKVDCYAVLR